MKDKQKYQIIVKHLEKRFQTIMGVCLFATLIGVALADSMGFWKDLFFVAGGAFVFLAACNADND